jgi:hypothetical protein
MCTSSKPQQDQKVPMVIEQFRDGATVRGFLQPTFHWVTVFLSGVSCPGFKRPEVLFFMLLSLF